MPKHSVCYCDNRVSENYWDPYDKNFTIIEKAPDYYIFFCNHCGQKFYNVSLYRGAGSYSVTAALSEKEYSMFKSFKEPERRYEYLERKSLY